VVNPVHTSPDYETFQSAFAAFEARP